MNKNKCADQRGRYNSSLIDSDILPKGISVENISDSYVIFITEPDEMNFKQLADITSYYKKDKEGIRAMCKAMEDMIIDFVTEDKKNSAIRMLKAGKLSEKDIAEYLDLSMDVIEELAKQEGVLVK